MKNNENIITVSDLLFELSNDIRYDILRLIKSDPKRPSIIASELKLSPSEVSRSFTRLNEAHLITKNVDNHYSITNFGEHILHLLEELEFITSHKEYFLSHCSVKIPLNFQKRMSELCDYSMTSSFMEFVTAINEILENSKKFIWMYIDQYPLIALDAIRASLDNGTKIRIIEQRNLLGPEIVFDKKHHMKTLDGVPGVQIRKRNACDVYLILADAGAVVAFPSETGFDYSGFVTRNNCESSWGADLFEHYWANSMVADLGKMVLTEDIIDLSNVNNSRKRADEWVKIFSRLDWTEGQL
ncbi:MAG: ArsR family transcriptional regulator [Candidatus Bathyarchaeota archaeon]|nr:ArsR family transcriptional regulator [Candidatus Bathyarchaeota archaeon]